MEHEQPEMAAGKPEIPYESFAALDLRAARVVSAERHPNADKLLVLRIDLGEQGERRIFQVIQPGFAVGAASQDRSDRQVVVEAADHGREQVVVLQGETHHQLFSALRKLSNSGPATSPLRVSG